MTLGSLALFLVLLALLAARVRAGDDPALGAGTPVADVAQRRVVVHRVIVRRVIVTEPAPRPRPPVAGASSGPAVVVPVAPAPAPLTTGSS